MATGKARFWVKKLADFSQSEFRIKTQTAIVGVRGSDFIVNASEDITEVTTLDKTVLEIVSLIALEKKTLLKDFERTTVKRGFIPSDVISVTPEETEQMIKEMPITPERFKSVSGPHDPGMERRYQKKVPVGEPHAGPDFEESFLIPGTPENKLPGEKSEPHQGENPFTEAEPAKDDKLPLINDGQISLQQPLPQAENGAILPETPPLNEPLSQIKEEIPLPDKQSQTALEGINKTVTLPEGTFVKPEDMGYQTEPESSQIDFDIIDKKKVLPEEDSDKYKPKQNKEDQQRSGYSKQP